jgi:hypothetical protein
VLLVAGLCIATSRVDASYYPPAPINPVVTAKPTAVDIARHVPSGIETKVPESKRADERQRLDYFRTMLVDSPTARAAAGLSCKDNLRREIQNDSYGCYGDEAAKAGIQTACSLLRLDELEKVLRAPFANGVQDGSACTYEFAGKAAGPTFRINVHWSGGRDEVDGARAGAAMAKSFKATRLGDSMIDSETIAGVGDEAIIVKAGGMLMLYARKGDASIEVEAFGAKRDELIPIAQIALGRLQPESR